MSREARSERWAERGAAASRTAAKVKHTLQKRRVGKSSRIIGFLNCISFFVHSQIWLARIYFSRSGLHGFGDRGRNAEVAECDGGHPVDGSVRFPPACRAGAEQPAHALKLLHHGLARRPIG